MITVAADLSSCVELANTDQDSTNADHNSWTHAQVLNHHEMDIYSQSSAESGNEIEETSEINGTAVAEYRQTEQSVKNAGALVCGTVELLEQILLVLPIRDNLRAELVNR